MIAITEEGFEIIMDSLDTEIVSLLQQDGRYPNAAIARHVGVSEGTVRRRLKKLFNEEYIHVKALLDPLKMGYGSEALLGVQVDPDKIEYVANKLAGLKEINWIAVTTGAFDVFAWVTLPTSEKLGLFLSSKVGVISGIRRTETFVSLNVKKRSYSFEV